MIPKLHKKGTSFKGAAAYLLHDKRVDGKTVSTSDRIEWVETRNLATNNPDSAWRVMAATSMDADHLKQQAGVKATGRKSNLHVMHMSLSWHPDEKLTRDEMLGAAEGALAVLGASDRQAMLIAHNDENHQHVHILLNRISDQDGRILSTSNEKRKLSTWAEKYEKDRKDITGRIFCEERVLNNNRRRANKERKLNRPSNDNKKISRAKLFENYELIETVKDTPRHIFEAQKPVIDMIYDLQEAANDNLNKVQSIKERKKALNTLKRSENAKDAALANQAREMQQNHAKASQELHSAYKNRLIELEELTNAQPARVKSDVAALFRTEQRMLFIQHREETAEYEANEKSLIGQAKNIYKSMMGSESRISTLFSVLTSSDKRRSKLDTLHAQDIASLETKKKAAYDQSLESFTQQQRQLTAKYRNEFLGKLQRFTDTKTDQIKAFQKKWRTRNTERRTLFDKLKNQQWKIAQIKSDLNKAASPALDQKIADRLPPIFNREANPQKKTKATTDSLATKSPALQKLREKMTQDAGLTDLKKRMEGDDSSARDKLAKRMGKKPTRDNQKPDRER